MAGKAQQQEHGEEEQRQVPIPGSFLFCVPSGTSVGWCGLHPEWAGLTSRVGGAPACGMVQPTSRVGGASARGRVRPTSRVGLPCSVNPFQMLLGRLDHTGVSI